MHGYRCTADGRLPNGSFLMVGAAAQSGLSDETVWAGLTVFAYVLGVTELAWTESTPIGFLVSE